MGRRLRALRPEVPPSPGHRRIATHGTGAPAAVSATLCLGVVLLGACAAGTGRATPPDAPTPASQTTVTSPALQTFPGGAGLDYQLGGAYPPPDGVGVVVRDSTAEPAAGVWSVCYVNGYQTQPGEQDRWTGDRADLVVRDAAGDPVVDPGWPDEMILDTADAGKRERIAAEMTADIDRCARRGFAAVELDNLDTFTRIDGPTHAGNIALAQVYAGLAHDRGLLVGQKNAAEYTQELRDEVGFDFAVAEECVANRECAAYTDVYGEAVLAVEYPADSTDSAATLAAVCADPTRPPSTVVRDHALAAAGKPGHFVGRC